MWASPPPLDRVTYLEVRQLGESLFTARVGAFIRPVARVDSVREGLKKAFNELIELKKKTRTEWTVEPVGKASQQQTTRRLFYRSTPGWRVCRTVSRTVTHYSTFNFVFFFFPGADENLRRLLSHEALIKRFLFFFMWLQGAEQPPKPVP